jgi:hypothetical protein
MGAVFRAACARPLSEQECGRSVGGVGDGQGVSEGVGRVRNMRYSSQNQFFCLH